MWTDGSEPLPNKQQTTLRNEQRPRSLTIYRSEWGRDTLHAIFEDAKPLGKLYLVCVEVRAVRVVGVRGWRTGLAYGLIMEYGWRVC